MHSTHKACITRSMICRPCFSPRWQSSSIVVNQVATVPIKNPASKVVPLSEPMPRMAKTAPMARRFSG